jgi:hypothetical protein
VSEEKHKLIRGFNNTWIVRLTPGAAAHIHVNDNEPTGPFRGYGGSILQFEMEDGSIYEIKGPWHTNADALFKDTGLLITDLHMTRVVIRDGYPDSKVIYEEEKPVLGPFMRGERIAHQLADLMERRLFVSSYSEGGSSSHTVHPHTEPHVMAIRGKDDEAWGSR